MTPKQIEKILDEALRLLIENDSAILIANINERSISHKLAIYLEPFFSDWDVDCEYNRDHDDPKKLEIPRDSISTDDTEARTVFPDIIVHKRGSDENLFVIEMKKTSSRVDDDFDFLKLNAFKSQLEYKYAVFVKVRTKGEAGIETIKWV